MLNILEDRMSASRAAVVGAVLGVLLAAGSQPLCAEGRPIRQLPADVGQLATVWVAVPRAMAAVTQDDGPVLGMTVGAVEGTSHMVEDAVSYLTEGYTHDRRSQYKRPMGALLIYTF
jgi:hypothetical protein